MNGKLIDNILKTGKLLILVVYFSQLVCGFPLTFPLLAGLQSVWGQTRGKEVPNMRNYEVVLVIHPDLDEAALNSTVEKAKGWVTEAGGTVTNVELWGKRHMAYSLRKQREGQYVLLKVSMAPSFTVELERNLRFLEPVMRFLITAVEE
jgi:small subunit ribosomal protein S6